MKIFFAFFVAVVLILGFVFFYWHGHLQINSERFYVFFTRDGYHSFGFEYSYGQQWQPDGTWKNIWHRPRWVHFSVPEPTIPSHPDGRTE